jgi:ATP-dependent exoDNAse (exonuclease V) beta subunit
VERSDIAGHIWQARALLARFQADPRWPELNAARRWHEVPYSVTSGDLPSLGVIDILFQPVGNAENWCVIDVKTDQILEEDDLQAKVEDYSPQLRRYGQAVRSLLGGQVEMEICFLDFAGGVRWETIS